MFATRNLKSNSALLPTIGVALLPKLTCPACWPAYAGLLSSVGISFVDYTPYLMPFTLAFLAISLATLAYRAPSRHGYGPLLLGLIAGIILMVGKFGYNNDTVMYAGLGFLVAASVWNTWPRNSTPGAVECTSCNND